MEATRRIATPGVNPAAEAGTIAPAMDREFIIKNQIVERYLAGRLPPKGVTDFEKLIRSRPELIEELGLPEKVNAGLRLLDAAGIAEPWAEKPQKLWEKPIFGIGAAAFAVIALLGAAILALQVSSRDDTIAKLKRANFEQPIAPSTRKRSIIVGTARNGPPRNSSLTISHGEFAELKIDVAWTKYASYRASIDRVDQGRVAVIDSIARDSNGHLRLSLNAGAFGPGDYMVALEGLNLRRESVPVGWFRVTVAR